MAVRSTTDQGSTPGDTPASSSIPTFTRKATGLVREVSLFQQIIFNCAGASTLGLSLVFALFSVQLFPRCNLYVAIPVALLMGVFVWMAYGLLSAAIPRVGGDYTFNTRILHPVVGFAGNMCVYISTVLSAGVWAWWTSTQGLAPVLSAIGAAAHSSTLSKLGGDFSASHTWLPFLVSVIALVVVAALAVRGIRVTMRVMAILFMIATVAFFVDFAILLFTSHASFVNRIDTLGGPHTYAATIAAGTHLHTYPNVGGYSTSQTIGSIFYAIGAVIYTYWGAYISSEFKGANHRDRQLTSMLGAGLGQGILVYIAAVIFLRTVGYDFFASAVNGNYASPGGAAVGYAGYVYFANVIVHSTFLVVVLGLGFLGWFLPGQYINAAMAQRAIFTWSFDGLLHRRVSAVSDRLHTPVTAIAITTVIASLGAAWVSFDNTKFFAIFSVLILFGYIPIGLVGLSATVMKWRRPDLYKGSAADWRVAGITVLPVVGLGCLLVGVTIVVLAFVYHTQIGLTGATAFLGLSYQTLEWLAPVVAILGSAAWYYGVRAHYARRGQNLDLVYRAIPPD